MADLTIDYITSLDGFGAAEGWPGLWGMGGKEYLAFLSEDAERDYTLLMGGNTYRLFAGPDGGEPDEVKGKRKIVFTSRETDPPPWDNTSVIAGDAVDAVRAMKKTDGHLQTIGSPGLGRSLLKAGLVDRYRVVVFPLVTGVSGRDQMYEGWPDVELDLIGSRTLDGRLTLFEYAPKLLSGPPTDGEPWAGNSAELRKQAREA
jgi:dihydrofolate reductase